MSANGPLVGYTVLGMAGVGPDPMCAMLLAALPGRWSGPASQIGRGTWCVARRAG